MIVGVAATMIIAIVITLKSTISSRDCMFLLACGLAIIIFSALYKPAMSVLGMSNISYSVKDTLVFQTGFGGVSVAFGYGFVLGAIGSFIRSKMGRE